MSKISNVKAIKFYYDEEERNSDNYILIADFDKRVVTTNYGDFYYDYDISFDDFLKFAKHIEKEDKIYNKKRGGRMTELNLIDITNDKELMDRVLKRSEEMQEEILKKAEEE